MTPSDNFFYTGAIFLIFVKIENGLCPLPYEEALEDIIKAVWTEQCGNIRIEIFAGPRILMVRTQGKIYGRYLTTCYTVSNLIIYVCLLV